MSKATAGKQTAKFKIKKGDTVMVMSGKDTGKKGLVLTVIPTDAKVVVEGIAIVKRHLKARGAGQVGRIAERPAAIHISNVMVIDPGAKKPTRVKREMRDGKNVRVAVKSGEKLS